MGEGSIFIKQLRNPAYGLIPMLVFSFVLRWLGAPAALLTALMLSIIGFMVVKKQSRLIYHISIVAFVISLIVLFLMGFKFDVLRTFVIVEIIFVFTLIATRLSRTNIIVRLMAQESNSPMKNYLNEAFRIAFHSQYGFSIHLLLVLTYFVFSTAETTFIDTAVVRIVFQLIVLTIIVLQIIRFSMLDKKLKKEDWLPVVTESGEVTGRIAKSVTKEMKNKFMHPVVRVALISNGKIYLKKRDASRLLNPGALDYPFEKYMQYNHDIDEAVHNAVRKEIGIEEIPLRFLLKYIFENSSTKRLVFLYVSIIDDDEKFNKLRLQDGKLWTEKQIEDNRDSNIFSECFELEFEYLKNTVLLNHKLKSTEAS